MDILLIVISTAIAATGLTAWWMSRRTRGSKSPTAQPPASSGRPSAPRVNFNDEISGHIEVAMGGTGGLGFRFIAQTHLFEVRAVLRAVNRGAHDVKISRLSWDVWMNGALIKHGEHAEAVPLPAGGREIDIALRDVLKESEAAELSWAEQKPGTEAFMEGTLFLETPFGKARKNFSLLGIKHTVDKDAAKPKASEFVRQAFVDGLTGLLQRKFIEDNLQSLIERNLQNDPLSVMMIDIDKFKEINDEHGHQAGDEVLRTISSYLRAIVADRGFCVRYGGDEICVILTGCPLAEAKQLAEQFIGEVRQATVDAGGRSIPFTVSIGIACVTERVDYRTLIRHADEMLLYAKKTGKNKISVDSRRITAS